VLIPKSPSLSRSLLHGVGALRAAAFGFLLAITTLGAAPSWSASPSRETLLESVRSWAASQAGTTPSQVELGPLDARLQVRDCGQPLAYDFPFASRNTVRVRCTNPDWQLHIRVAYLQQPAATVANPQAAGGPSRADSDRVMVVVPRSNLRAGQILTADVVEATPVETRGVSRDFITVTDGLEQFEAARPLRAGEPLRPSDLRPALLVRKGQSVVLSMRSDALNIEVRLEATQDGRMGDQIRLVNPDSGRTVSGIVTGRNAARMI